MSRFDRPRSNRDVALISLNIQIEPHGSSVPRTTALCAQVTVLIGGSALLGTAQMFSFPLVDVQFVSCILLSSKRNRSLSQEKSVTGKRALPLLSVSQTCEKEE